MKYKTKSREELIEEIEAMRQQIAELKAAEAIRKNATEEELYRKKLRDIVEIAEDVFHEINQPMQAILGYTDLLLIHTSIDNPTHEKLTTIKKQTIRMSNVTKKLIKIKNYEFQDY
jgi:signal transduction histidine kinase